MNSISTKLNILISLVAILILPNLVPAQETKSFETVDSVELHYSTFGNGSPVLLLTGGPGYSSIGLKSVAAEIGKTHQAILLDQRGTGKSVLDKATPQSLNIKRAVEDIEELRKHEKLDKLTIFGHSWGGLLAMFYASEYPTRIENLILVGAGGVTPESFKYLEANVRSRLSPTDLDAIKFWSEPLRVSKNPERAAYERNRAAFPAYVFDRKNALLLIEETTPETFRYESHILLLTDLFKSQYDLRPKLKNLQNSVLVLQGRQDVIGETTAYQIHETFPNSNLVFIEQSGHFPWIEQKDKFYKEVKDFLNK